MVSKLRREGCAGWIGVVACWTILWCFAGLEPYLWTSNRSVEAIPFDVVKSRSKNLSFKRGIWYSPYKFTYGKVRHSKFPLEIVDQICLHFSCDGIWQSRDDNKKIVCDPDFLSFLYWYDYCEGTSAAMVWYYYYCLKYGRSR